MASPIPVYLGRVTAEGELRIWQPAAYAAHLRTLAAKDVEVVVRKRVKRRSNQQSRWEWGVAIPILADHLGWDMHEREALHYELVKKCFGTHWNEALGVEVPNVRSSKLTTEEYGIYMDWLVRYASVEHSCIIPLPERADVPTSEGAQ